MSFSVGHIYIGTIGIEGAFEGMVTSEVDVTWAKQYHDLWHEEISGQLESSQVKSGREEPAKPD